MATGVGLKTLAARNIKCSATKVRKVQNNLQKVQRILKKKTKPLLGPASNVKLKVNGLHHPFVHE